MRRRIRATVAGTGIAETKPEVALRILAIASDVRHRTCLAAAEVVDAYRVTLTLGHRMKAHDHAPCLASSNGKDARAQESMSHPLDERGIAALPHAVHVDTARLVGAHGLAGDELAVDLELQPLERGVLRKRKEVVRHSDSAAAIDEGLFDLVVQHPVAQLDLVVAVPSH